MDLEILKYLLYSFKDRKDDLRNIFITATVTISFSITIVHMFIGNTQRFLYTSNLDVTGCIFK